MSSGSLFGSYMTTQLKLAAWTRAPLQAYDSACALQHNSNLKMRNQISSVARLGCVRSGPGVRTTHNKSKSCRKNELFTNSFVRMTTDVDFVPNDMPQSAKLVNRTKSAQYRAIARP